MEWTKPTELPSLVENSFKDQRMRITYTQWEDDNLDADEALTTFTGSLQTIEVTKNQIQGFDVRFTFLSEGQEENIDILMDFPPDDEDVVAQMIDDTTLQILGNESTLEMKKGL